MSTKSRRASTATPEDVHEHLKAGRYSKALSTMLPVLQNKALGVLTQIGIELAPGPRFKEASPADLAGGAFAAAKAELERRSSGLSPADLERGGCAVDVLEAAWMLHVRLEAGVPGNGGVQAAMDTVSELVFLGGLLGQADFALTGSMEGVFQDALKARLNRDARRENQAKLAAARVTWHAPVLEKARRICKQRPQIKSTDLADQIHEDPTIETPSSAAVLAFIRAARKSGELPPRIKI